MLSTRDTPETAASPDEVTITVSAIPTVIRRNCSMTKGMIRRIRACLVNIGALAGTDWASDIQISLPFMLRAKAVRNIPARNLETPSGNRIKICACLSACFFQYITKPLPWQAFGSAKIPATG